jgi:hypothetical protein
MTHTFLLVVCFCVQLLDELFESEFTYFRHLKLLINVHHAPTITIFAALELALERHVGDPNAAFGSR